MNKFEGYDSTTEERIQILYSLMKEDDRRRYAAVEALKIGYGGRAYIGLSVRLAGPESANPEEIRISQSRLRY